MEDAIAQAVNAGLDMSMIPLDAGSPDNGFVPNLLKAVADGKVTEARIDQAVRAHPDAEVPASASSSTRTWTPSRPTPRSRTRRQPHAGAQGRQESLVLLGNDGDAAAVRTARGASS